jgi:prepilin-type N-terminal cleavage/methylation domain-containing protein
MQCASDPRPAFRGFTLLELVVVLVLLGLSMAELLPAARRQLDRMAVLGAREEVAGLLHRARGEALARGGAELVLTSEPPRAELIALEDTLARTKLEDSYGVTLGLSRDRPEARLKFGPLGLGLVASQTVRFRRGDAEALLVMSSLGRVARR